MRFARLESLALRMNPGTQNKAARRAAYVWDQNRIRVFWVSDCEQTREVCPGGILYETKKARVLALLTIYELTPDEALKAGGSGITALVSDGTFLSPFSSNLQSGYIRSNVNR
jgi:hypothetical protein